MDRSFERDLLVNCGGLSRPLPDSAGPEIVPLNLQRDFSSLGSDYYAPNLQLQLDVPVEHSRPVDVRLNGLPEVQRGVGGEAEPGTAQVDAAARAHLQRPIRGVTDLQRQGITSPGTPVQVGDQILCQPFVQTLHDLKC